MVKILKLLKTIKIISISEINRSSGNLRTIHQHFFEIEKDVQQKLDSLEMKSGIQRAMPIIYIYENQRLLDKEQTLEKANQLVLELKVALEQLQELCLISVKPVRCCGKRTNCCGRSLLSLFHESKQMGIVLRKSFKGTHFWIPPIKKQIEDAQAKGFKNIKQVSIDYDVASHMSDTVKIDAMFFTANEQPVVLWGDEGHKDGDETDVEHPVDLTYLNFPTFILCNPNAMAY